MRCGLSCGTDGHKRVRNWVRWLFFRFRKRFQNFRYWFESSGVKGAFWSELDNEGACYNFC
jgi:hypothetical protein